MVDLVITAANVVAGSNARTAGGQAGEAIAAGKLVYKNSTSNKYMLADTNSATAEARKPTGIAVNAAALNQPIDVVESGDIIMGATLVAGDAYYASDTPGGICPRADVGTTENVVLVGLARSASVLAVDIQVSGVTL